MGQKFKVWRGEYSETELLSRLGSFSFTDSIEVAEIYANNPNDKSVALGVQVPMIIEAEIEIKNPVFDCSYDPMIDYGVLVEKVGESLAACMFIRHSEAVKNTNAWEELFAPHYNTVQELYDKEPTSLWELGLNVYHLLDCPETVGELKQKGFDGAIHAGSGASMEAIEYKVFSATQIKVLNKIKLTDEAIDNRFKPQLKNNVNLSM